MLRDVLAVLARGSSQKLNLREKEYGGHATSLRLRVLQREGGSDASIICVPQSINSALGSRWGSKLKGNAGGTQFRVKIKGLDCSQTPVDKKRSVSPGNMVTRTPMKDDGVVLKKNDTDIIYVDESVYANKTDGSIATLIPFYIPDNFVGTFNVNYNIASGTLKPGFLIDDWGNYYGS
ncbi:hypothetical protein N7474_004075 [Penicillium riverlandense]|uniref:uncharacterized protein n=1 Tax=Penicillium riverlandense TaxID=1903569 RepID=UPI00254809BF|nr:uncharacterized protein N7474_004075 [Penicillium riverlandense]KAJ5818484.1 hypothetical protein N7474_004075 [Penicillium riverlandense]